MQTNNCLIFSIVTHVNKAIFLPQSPHAIKFDSTIPLIWQILKMKNGEIYRGLLLNAEDTMNMTLSDVVKTARNGQVSKIPTVYLRGSSVRFISLPDLLKNAPVFKKVTNMKKKAESYDNQTAGVKRKQRDVGTHTLVFRDF